LKGMSLTWSVRTSDLRDRDLIIDVVESAFANGGRDGGEEVAIVRDTWAINAAAEGLDLVAVDGGQVLGHVLGATGRLGGRPVIGIAPLSVAPTCQRQGVGTALMTELLDRAERAEEPMVVLLGDPEYYRRFGFENSAPLGISYPPVGAGNPHFMVRRFTRFDPTYRGEYAYCWQLPQS
jgi:putative acetyltransferase